ncbi:sce7726 family protein [Priestia megaterium]|uniref:sce7726 family protein n=1 Tax=Priestia megaterium TaxID=1404 RepID=UPI00244971B0|nr:sce7726 family protein [Priestia megaterium]MDH2452140.1 sce7726 family protein [Priestia megaterium]MDL5151597.1 sce7726 family protein [Priestia megaterium]
MIKLKDSDIRKVLTKRLEKQYAKDFNTKIVHEMGILHGQSRVDLAVINGTLHGFEIKSESDTLTRLNAQMLDYNKVFDRMTIVVQRNYLNKVRDIVPKWWGIILVTRYKGELHLREVRKGKSNPSVDPFSLSHLLWRKEALNILKEKGLQRGYLSKPRDEIYKKICSSITLNEIKLIVNQCLKKRESWKVH